MEHTHEEIIQQTLLKSPPKLALSIGMPNQFRNNFNLNPYVPQVCNLLTLRFVYKH